MVYSYISSENPEDWKKLLADPEKQWKKGYSARTLAYCWCDQKCFPKEIKRVFNDFEEEPFKTMEFLFVFPEYKVYFPPIGGRPSQNDIFVIGRGGGDLVSICVEGKISESFSEVVHLNENNSSGMLERLDFITNTLGLNEQELEGIRYQLLHRTLSSVLMAEQLNAPSAIMLVHSFSKKDEWFEDYAAFVKLFGVEAVINKVHESNRLVSGKRLYFAWVKGNQKYLEY